MDLRFRVIPVLYKCIVIFQYKENRKGGRPLSDLVHNLYFVCNEMGVDCFAFNTGFFFISLMCCFLAGPPDAPTNLRVLNRTANSIDIRWNEGPFDGNSRVQNFSVTIFKDGKPLGCIISPSNNDTSCIVSNSQRSFSGLKPHTTYKFTVCSINSIGKTCTDGNFSVMTLEDGLLCF